MKDFSLFWAAKRTFSQCAIGLVVYSIMSGPGQISAFPREHALKHQPEGAASAPSVQPGLRVPAACNGTGKEKITINCNFLEAPASAKEKIVKPRIVLNHAEISFRTRDEDYMNVELAFTNRSRIPISQARSVYIAIDNEADDNFVRRRLTHVDLGRLEPGKRFTFQERLLVGVLPPGNYVVHLWIPHPDAELKFKPVHNFLLSNIGVPDRKTGLNTLARFVIVW